MLSLSLEDLNVTSKQITLEQAQLQAVVILEKTILELLNEDGPDPKVLAKAIYELQQIYGFINEKGL